MLEKCTALVSFSAEECRKLQAPVLTTAAQYCRQLETVLLSGCFLLKDREVEALVRACTSLSHLSLRECNQLRDPSVQAISEAQLSQLTYLDLCWTGMRHSLVTVAESSGAGSLQSLHLSWCQLMDENSLNYSISRFSSLTQLNLSWRAITDAAFGAMIGSLPYLIDLDISGCSELTPTAFQYFAGRTGNEKLQQLTLAWCQGLNDDGLTVLAKECPLLTSIDLSICSKITERSLRELGKRATNLRRLILSRCAPAPSVFARKSDLIGNSSSRRSVFR